MTRDRLIKLVDSMRAMIEKRVLSSPRVGTGVRFVVVAIDPDAQWVAISSNTSTKDVQSILEAAGARAKLKYRDDGPVIEVAGEERT